MAGTNGRRRRTGVITAVVVALVFSLAGWVAATQFSTGEGARYSPPEATTITAPVEHRVLERVVTARGQVVAARSTEVSVGSTTVSGADPIISAVHVGVGDSISEGKLLFEVAGRPVVVLSGAVPMWRDFGEGASGSDVAALQDALIRLRLLRGQASKTFDTRTSNAVRLLYRRLGHVPPTRAEPSSAEGGEPRQAVFVSRSEVVFIPDLPARVEAVLAEVGKKADKGVLRVVSGGESVEATLEGDAREVAVGDQALVRAGSTEISGYVASIAAPSPSAAASGENAPPPAGPTVRITLDQAWPGDAPRTGLVVRVTIDTTHEPGLVVPALALHSRDDGTVFVIRLASDGSRTQVPVLPGLVSAGNIAVTTQSGDLKAGDRVVIAIG